MANCKTILVSVLLFATSSLVLADKSLTDLETENQYRHFERSLHFEFMRAQPSETVQIALGSEYRFLDLENSLYLLRWLKQPGTPGLVGTVLKLGSSPLESGSEPVLITEIQNGYLQDVELNSSKLLEDLQSSVKSVTQGRVNIEGWQEEPTFTPGAAPILSWSLKYKLDDKPVTQFNTAMLTRRGAIVLRNNGTPLSPDFLSRFEISPDARYSAFDAKKDPVQKDGLKGLILGQGAARGQTIVNILHLINNFLFLIAITVWLMMMKRARDKSKPESIDKNKAA